MAFGGFLSLGGTEIANASRTRAYAGEIVPMLGMEDCWDCADLAEVLGDDPYTTPLIDRPDWFTDHDPDSADFCGFYPLEIEGIDDGVREATVTELALDGAVVGAPRYRSREIKVTGLLIGATDAAVTYGLAWLSKALEGSPCRDSEGCTGDHLCYYSACPPMCTDSPALDVWPGEVTPAHHESQFYLCDGGLIESAARACSVDYERTLYQVSLTSGPTIVERYNSHCGSLLRVEFTLVAGVPFAFSTAISAVPGLEPIPAPQTVPEVTCTAGTDVVVRTNLATNPVPVGNAAAAGKGWLADGAGFTAAVDTTIYRMEGGSSVRLGRSAATDTTNLAPNPQPTGTLDGWGWRLGQSGAGSPDRVNLVENPWPRAADGWVYTVPEGDTLVRTNLAANPHAATADYWSWNVGFGGEWTFTNETGTDTPDGRAGYRRSTVVTPDTGGYCGHIYRQDIAGAAGEQITMSMWVRPSVETVYTLNIASRAAGVSTTLNSAASAPTVAPAGVWTRLSATLNTTVAYGTLQLIANESAAGPAAGATVDATQVLIEVADGVLRDYFDGDTADTADATYEWTGTADASTSTATAVSTFSTPMEVVTGGVGPDGVAGFVRRTQDEAGTQQWVVTYTGTQVLTAGATHTVSVYMRSTSARTVEFAGRTFSLPGFGWVRLTGQVTGDGGPLVLTITGTGQADGEVIDVARALVEESNTLGTYFDGSTPDAGGVTYAWTGDEDASTSTATMAPADVTTELATGTGPGSQTTFQRTTVTAPKAGGEDGPVYTMDAGEDLYTVTMQVRPSVVTAASLRVSALDAAGVVLTSVSGDRTSLPEDAWTSMPAVRIAAPAGTARLQVAVLLPADEALPAGATFDAGAVRVVQGLFLTDPVLGRATYVGQHDNTKTTIDVLGDGTYTASVYAGSNVAALATVSIAFYTSAGLPAGALTRGAPLDLAAWTTPIGVAQWRRPSVTATAPENAAHAVVSIEVRKLNSGAVVGDNAWITSALVEQAADVLSYFDGSLPDAGSVSYEWTGTAHASTSNTLLALAEPPGPIVDPDCPPVPAPPRPPVINVSCVDTPTTWRRYEVDVPEDLVPDWRDVIPILRLQTGATAARQVRARFYPNPLQAPLAALNPCDFCGEFVITYIPPNSIMTIDGIRQWVSVTDVQSGNVVTANHLLSSSDGGPVTWPVLSCGVSYTLVVDVSPTGVSDLEPQICLAARS